MQNLQRLYRWRKPARGRDRDWSGAVLVPVRFGAAVVAVLLRNPLPWVLRRGYLHPADLQ